MSDAEQPIPELYREAAEQVRQLSRQARLADIRDDLLTLAAKFERLAVYAETAIRLQLPGYPHGAVLGERTQRRFGIRCSPTSGRRRNPIGL